MISTPLALAAAVAAVTALAFWLDRRVEWLSRLGASLMAIVFGALLFGGAFGDQTWRLAGTFMGTYSGGSLNFVSVGRGLELPDTLFAGAAAADNLTTAIWLGTCLLLPGWLARWWPEGARVPAVSPPADDDRAGADAPADAARAAADRDDAPGEPAGDADEDADDDERHPFFATAPVSTLQLSLLFGVGVVLLIAADLVGRLVPGVPEVLWLTTLALIVGHTRPFARMDGALQLGNYALHLFFVVIGIFSRIEQILEVGLAVFLLTLTVVGVHGLVVFGLGRASELDPETLAVASQASVGGPSTALAVAASRKWPALLLPGVAVGLLGYAAGNYLGFAVAAAARAVGL